MSRTDPYCDITVGTEIEIEPEKEDLDFDEEIEAASLKSRQKKLSQDVGQNELLEQAQGDPFEC